MKTNLLKEEKGFALVIAMMLLLVVTFLGISAVNTATYDNLISGNKRASDQAFYISEAGINEFLGRFRSGATNEITDGAPTNPNWRLYLAVNRKRAEEIGFNSNNQNHTFVQSLPHVQLDFAVEVRHKVNSASPPQVITQGGFPIYIVKSYGYTSDGGNKVIEVEIQKASGVTPPSALYSKRPVDVLGTSTRIDGNDKCGQNNKPGIITMQTIDEHGKPTINGVPPYIEKSPLNLDITKLAAELRDFADFQYTYSQQVTLTRPLDNWGNPVINGDGKPLGPPADGVMKIVYFNMNGEHLKLVSNNMTGAGILVVEGDLSILGGFSWYGIIIATGSVNFLGGGQPGKNVTGSIMSGDRTTIDLETTVGGSTDILYCSGAIDKIEKGLPFKMTRWREIF